MQKCIFVGYPIGYKGWQFYNPVTKKFIISEQAMFDEHQFTGLSSKHPNPSFTLLPLTEPSDSNLASFVPELEGDNDILPPTQILPPEPIAPLPALLIPPVDQPAPPPPPASSPSPPPQEH
jgi:hypothetical protein